MNRLPLVTSLLIACIVAASVPVAAATVEYTFTVPFQVRSGGPGSIAGESTGAGAGRAPSMSVSCAVGPASLGFSTATGSASNANGSGTTANVSSSPAKVVVTVDGEPVSKTGAKLGAGALLQPKTANGFYTCWATFTTGQTPVNFLPTTALPKVAPKAA